MPVSEALLIDCLDFMATNPDNAFSLGIPDPPYGIGESSKNHKSRNRGIKQRNGAIMYAKQPDYGKSDWDSSTPPSIYFSELKRVTSNQIIWGANYYKEICGTPFKAPRRRDYQMFIEEHPTGWIIWDKVNGDNDFSDCELAWTSLDIPTTTFHYMWAGMFQGVSYKDGKTMQGNKKMNEKRVHCAQKPLALYQWVLETFARPGDVIYDSHMGSQGSRVAAYKLGFDYYGNEIDEKHYADGCKRFQQLTHEPLFQSIK